MQSTDFTTLMSVCHDLNLHCIPARLEQIYQGDRHTINLCLRTFNKKIWLLICWHPEAARICLTNPPPRIKDTFTFSEQLRHQLNGYALTEINTIAPYERVVNFKFAQRPGEEALYNLYIEIMGKYSNIILTDQNDQIITVGHQITANKSKVRTVETGQFYQIPPSLMGEIPKLSESLESWRETLSLIPGKLGQQMLKVYRGLSPIVVKTITNQANLDDQQLTETLNDDDWHNLYKFWQKWLNILEKKTFIPGKTSSGYTVLGWNIKEKSDNLHQLIDNYYDQQLQQENFKKLHHQLSQKINNILDKLIIKANIYKNKLTESDQCDQYRNQADLLMANLHQHQAGMKLIILKDFETDQPISIKLQPEKNAVQNAQFLYKQHQKLKRAKNAVIPLLEEVNTEIHYLTQIKTALLQLNNYTNKEDLKTILEIKDELINEKYLEDSQYRKIPNKEESKPHLYKSPSGFEILIGRNNRQNDLLTFHTATDYDLWFHSQEIPGAHVLLRLMAGEAPTEKDLEFTANLTAYYSQGRESNQVPVIYTTPKLVYKPKGAKPGMAIYKKETIIWGFPQKVVDAKKY